MWYEAQKARHAAQRNCSRKYRAQVLQGAWGSADHCKQFQRHQHRVPLVEFCQWTWHTHPSLAAAHRGAQENCGWTRITQQDEMRGPVRAHGRQVTPVRRKRETTALHTQAHSNPTHYMTPRMYNT